MSGNQIIHLNEKTFVSNKKLEKVFLASNPLSDNINWNTLANFKNMSSIHVQYGYTVTMSNSSFQKMIECFQETKFTTTQVIDCTSPASTEQLKDEKCGCERSDELHTAEIDSFPVIVSLVGFIIFQATIILVQCIKLSKIKSAREVTTDTKFGNIDDEKNRKYPQDIVECDYDEIGVNGSVAIIPDYQEVTQMKDSRSTVDYEEVNVQTESIPDYAEVGFNAGNFEQNRGELV